MKCKSCGGIMKKIDDHSMKCESCGETVKIEETKDAM